MPEQVIAAIPQSHPDNRLDVVVIRDGEQSRRVELRALTWGEGIGWYCQRTLTLDRATLQALHRALGAIQRQSRPNTPPPQARTIIPFPCGDAVHATLPTRALQPALPPSLHP